MCERLIPSLWIYLLICCHRNHWATCYHSETALLGWSNTNNIDSDEAEYYHNHPLRSIKWPLKYQNITNPCLQGVLCLPWFMRPEWHWKRPMGSPEIERRRHSVCFHSLQEYPNKVTVFKITLRTFHHLWTLNTAAIMLDYNNSLKTRHKYILNYWTFELSYFEEVLSLLKAMS